jgi:hypothetical protein
MRRAHGSLGLLLFFCCALATSAEGAGRAAKGKKATVSGRGERSRAHKRITRRKRPPAPPPMPARLEVVSIEPKSGVVRVGLLGPARPPETRLFVLTDDRGRRFVPATAECTTSDAVAEAAADTAPAENQPQHMIHWQCELTIAPLYRRAALTGVSMEWGDRIVTALPGQVAASWAEGPTTRPVPPPTPPAAVKPAPATKPASPQGSEPEPPLPGEDDEETDP